MAKNSQENLDSELLRSSRFRKERERDWRRLADLLQRVEQKGLQQLTYHESKDLSSLYRLALNSLSLAREISLDKSLLDYLESLCIRAYLTVYAPQERAFGVVTRYLRYGAPQAVRRSALYIFLAALFMTMGGLVAYWLTINDPSWYYAFVGREFSGGRGPEASREFLRNILYGKESHDLGTLTAFSVKLFTHNTQVALFSFALGIMATLPTGFLMFYNGAVVGAFFAVHEMKGLSWDLFGWLSIHGVTELSAIVIAAAGGFRLGAAFLFPGRLTRGAALRVAGRDAVKLAILAALMLVAAGLLEGFGRQLIQNIYIRFGLGWGVGALWLLWFVFGGRAKSDEIRNRAEM